MKVPPFKKAGSPRVLASLGLKSDSLLGLAQHPARLGHLGQGKEGRFVAHALEAQAIDK